jgi:integral membrane protein (TIGR01906 family)
MAGLMTVTDNIRAYLKGETSSLQVAVEVNGKARPFFNERELAHMEDVRKIKIAAERAGFGGIILFVAGALFTNQADILQKFRTGARGRLRARFMKNALFGMALALPVIAAAALYFVFNFDSAFVTFHRIFFRNDLWLLNPETDLLINIMPQGFFEDAAGTAARDFAFGYCFFAAGQAFLWLWDAKLRALRRNG